MCHVTCARRRAVVSCRELPMLYLKSTDDCQRHLAAVPPGSLASIAVCQYREVSRRVARRREVSQHVAEVVS